MGPDPAICAPPPGPMVTERAPAHIHGADVRVRMLRGMAAAAAKGQQLAGVLSCLPDRWRPGGRGGWSGSYSRAGRWPSSWSERVRCARVDSVRAAVLPSVSDVSLQREGETMSNPTVGRRRSRERIQFLADVIVSAVEGGGYGVQTWAEVTGYKWHADDLEGGTAGAVEYTAAQLREFDDFGQPMGEPVQLTIDLVAKGIGEITRGGDQFGEAFRRRVVEASRDNWAGDLDVVDADAIVQAAVFGAVVYG